MGILVQYFLLFCMFKIFCNKALGKKCSALDEKYLLYLLTVLNK